MHLQAAQAFLCGPYGQRRPFGDLGCDLTRVLVCGELLILAENTSVAQSCESFTYR